MLSKCANPSCLNTFRYLHEGTIFHVARGTSAVSFLGGSKHERFWLCTECASQMTVVSQAAGVQVVPLPDPIEKVKQPLNRSATGPMAKTS